MTRFAWQAILATMLAAAVLAPAHADQAKATFAGGCFWCMEPPFDKLDGVSATISGYAGGDTVDPTYEQVSSGRTGHTEVVQITYDPSRVEYETLLRIYWRNVDPFDGKGQFCDRGSQYRPAIFVHDERQERLATASRERVMERFDAPVEVTLEPLDAFYAAEDYHQNYYRKSSLRYKYYRYSCGRDDRLEAIWGDEAGGTGAS